ncbi:putative inositol phospholipid biosynthesis protein Scs3 [Aspergillus ibericus CBS 121593]|uniref:Acyl-coenzyme A diphosphatase SCS3 n=1 Tax=Aspergillus ibericus CBS 121593 TaxID=1448316 RepID=A0A395H050_9EURO|nr:hypothetical protein BO80DRAFT_502325 [Aspergillus ibericus CBS 121593]RAL00973.1 hypothetical protein BO80DRAFT_502325 [Aspergillus ibericus CBS 121593]
MPSPDPTPPPPASPPPTTNNRSHHHHHPPSTLLLIYPATLLLGCIFSILSPTAKPIPLPLPPTPPLAPSIATDLNTPTPLPPTIPINYFARKDNIFNLYFVKIGWFWTTLTLLCLLLSQPAYTRAPIHRARRTLQAGIRWAIATSVWYIITQWFFGPPIMDRGFVMTGGGCERVVPLVEGAIRNEGAGDEVDFKTVVTAVACKSVGGAWRGGHDVSGHVFLLVVMVSVVVFEVVGAGRRDFRGGIGEGKKGGEDEDEKGDRDEVGEGEGEMDGVRDWSGRLAWMVAGLGWWMLLMTAIWFHTWFEKVTGLLIALGTVYTIYILPRRVPEWRNVVGLPGV